MHAEIHVDLICQGERYRPVDPKKAGEIAQSMGQQGLLQPIGVKPCRCEALPQAHYRLLFGAHRLYAARELQWEALAATVFSIDLPNEMGRLAELQENNARHDLTQSQRKNYTQEIARLAAQLKEHAHLPSEQKNWLLELSKTSGTPFNTLRNWWNSFCQERELSATPGEANDNPQLQQNFLDWMAEQYQKAEDEKKRKEDEARARRMNAECAKAIRFLMDLIQEYGFETVQHGVWDVVYTQYEASLQDAGATE